MTHSHLNLLVKQTQISSKIVHKARAAPCKAQMSLKFLSAPLFLIWILVAGPQNWADTVRIWLTFAHEFSCHLIFSFRSWHLINH